MEIKYLKSAARLLNRDYVNRRGLDLSKEVLWISVFQRTVNLQVVRSEKKILLLGRSPTKRRWPGFESCLTDRNFVALLPAENHSTSFERSKPLLLT